MVGIEVAALAREVERVRRLYAWLLSEVPGTREAQAVWELSGRTICWHVVLRDIDEPDIDVEMLPDAVVVRAGAEQGMRLAVLPLPAPFRPRRPVVRFAMGVLEVRVEA